MRYWFIKFAIQHGEYGFHSTSVEKTEGNVQYDADADAKMFYGCKEGEKQHPESDWYTFNAGDIAVRVQSCMEISESEYNVLNRF